MNIKKGDMVKIIKSDPLYYSDEMVGKTAEVIRESELWTDNLNRVGLDFKNRFCKYQHDLSGYLENPTGYYIVIDCIEKL